MVSVVRAVVERKSGGTVGIVAVSGGLGVAVADVRMDVALGDSFFFDARTITPCYSK